jgi:hypothetical protein
MSVVAICAHAFLTMAGPTRLSGMRRSIVNASTIRRWTQSAVQARGWSNWVPAPGDGGDGTGAHVFLLAALFVADFGVGAEARGLLAARPAVPGAGAALAIR